MTFKKKLLTIIGIANLVLITFVGVIHQRGPISVMKHLRTFDLDENQEAILFLTPCHSSPYYRYNYKFFKTFMHIVSIKLDFTIYQVFCIKM